MSSADLLAFCLGALREHRLRTFLSLLGIAVGVTAVVALTSIGEGSRVYVMSQFQQFGTNVLQVTPGKTETFGLPGAIGGTTHPLTLEDAEALRRLSGVERVVPAVIGQARVEAAPRGRSVFVYGVSADAPEVWKLEVRHGSFLPPGDVLRGGAVAVLGPKLESELFPDGNAVGRWVRAGGWRLRVIGVLRPKGRILGFDMDDSIYVPAATALSMFDADEVSEVDVTFRHESSTDAVVAGIRRALRARHGGREDFTVVTQADMLGVFDRVLRTIGAGVAGIAAVSLVVGAIGILTVMWIASGQRTSEIGLLRAIGATAAQVRSVFLVEAGVLALLGGLLGWLLGAVVALLLGLLLPGLPVSVPWPYVALALAGSVATGLFAGLGPARRAARLDPVEALRAE